MFLKRTRVFQIPRDKGSVYPRVYNGRKNEEGSEVWLFKVGVLGRMDRISENLRRGPWIVKAASFSVPHYRQFPNTAYALEVQMDAALLRCSNISPDEQSSK